MGPPIGVSTPEIQIDPHLGQRAVFSLPEQPNSPPQFPGAAGLMKCVDEVGVLQQTRQCTLACPHGYALLLDCGALVLCRIP